MEEYFNRHPGRTRLRKIWKLRAWLLVSLIWLGPTLACGSFAPRPTPTPTVAAIEATAVTGAQSTPTPLIDLQAKPVPIVVADTPTPAPAPTALPQLVDSTGLAAGRPARDSAPAGLNMRDQPTTNGQLLLQLPTNQKVSVLEGPTAADDLRWWRVDDGNGNVGWVADSDGETEWLSPSLGEPQIVDRSPKVGDRVQVTMSSGGPLSVRITPGTDAELVVRVNQGDQFTVMGGPQSDSGYTWYQIRSDDGAIEGWAAEGDGTERWLSPLE